MKGRPVVFPLLIMLLMLTSWVLQPQLPVAGMRLLDDNGDDVQPLPSPAPSLPNISPLRPDDDTCVSFQLTCYKLWGAFADVLVFAATFIFVYTLLMLIVQLLWWLWRRALNQGRAVPNGGARVASNIYLTDIAM